MSFVERFIIQCPYFGGSTVIAKEEKDKQHGVLLCSWSSMWKALLSGTRSTVAGSSIRFAYYGTRYVQLLSNK